MAGSKPVVKWRAASLAAFLEEGVMRLVDKNRAENDILAVVEAGTADVAAGRYRTISIPEDALRLHENIMARLHARLISEE